MKENQKLILCRVCLLITDSKLKRKCVSLFEKHINEDTLISDSINLIANVKIRKGDGLPDKICPDCLLELDNAINFKLKCENSNLILEGNTQNASDVPNDEVPVENLLLEVKKEEPFDETYLEDNIFSPDNNESELELENEVKLETETLKDENMTGDKLPLKKSKAIDLKLQCHDCGGYFKSKCKLRVHWKKTHFYETLICPYCKRSFKSTRAYQRHVKSRSFSCRSAANIRIEGVGKQRVFHCTRCSYSSPKMKDVATHFLTHSGERPVQCNLCDRKFTQHSTLESHKEYAHKIFKIETTCHFCGKYIKGRNKLRMHLKKHSNNYVQCDICKKKLHSKDALKCHIQRHTGVKSYTCEQCAQSFYTLSDLSNHKRKKHEKHKYEYKCDICGYKATRAARLKEHKLKHSKSDFPCIICGMFTTNAEELAVHMKRHLAQRKFECWQCDKKFLRKKGLGAHVRKIHGSSLLARPIKRGDMFEIEVKMIPLSNH